MAIPPPHPLTQSAPDSGRPTGERPTRVRHIVLGLTVAAYMITYMDRQILAVARPAIRDELGNPRGRRWIEIGKHRNDVPALRINLQVTVHARRATSVTEMTRSAVRALIKKTECVFPAAARCSHFSGS